MAQSFKIHVHPKVKTAITFSSAALAFALIALGSGKINKNGIEVSALAALGDVIPGRAVSSVSEAQRKANLEALYARNELYRQLDSGTRSPEEIQKELTDAIGTADGIEFKKGAFDRAYKLSMVMTHFKSQEGTPYEVLFIHNFAINGLREDGVTLYSRRIDGVEENTTSNILIVPQTLELNENSEPVLNSKNQMTYLFQLEPHVSLRPFDHRDPEAIGGFKELSSKVFNPLSLLARPDTFENGSYHQQIITPDGPIWNTQVTLRRTDIGTVTLEVRAQEVGSSVTQTSVLVYEEL